MLKIAENHFKFITFVSFSVYSSGFKPTFVLIRSSVSTTIIPSTHPNTVKVFAVVVNLSNVDAANVIKNLKIFSNRLNDDEILVRNFVVVKLLLL